MATDDELYVGDEGTKIRVKIKDKRTGKVVNIADASSRLLKFQKPSGGVVSKTATLVNTGSDGLMEYTTVAGDLDEDGVWIVQGYVQIGSGKWHSSRKGFPVHPVLT